MPNYYLNLSNFDVIEIKLELQITKKPNKKMLSIFMSYLQFTTSKIDRSCAESAKIKEYEQIQSKLLAIGSTAKLHTATIVTKPSVAHSAAFYQPKSVKEGEKLKSEASQCTTVKKSA